MLALPLAGAYAAGGKVIDGPDAAVMPNNGELDASLDMAPDGTGALAYVKKVGGKNEIMVSRRVGGEWLAPEQVSLFAGVNEASQPVVAAGNGGKVVVIWRHGPAQLFSAVRESAAAPWSPATPPNDVVGSNVVHAHDLAIGANGDVYAVYVTNGPDLRAARLGASGWEYVGTDTSANNAYPNPAGVLDNNPAAEVGDNSQTGPRVAVDASGRAVIVWTEGAPATDQKVFARRIEGLTPSAAIEVSPPNLEGALSSGTNDMLSLDVDAGGKAWIAWRYVAAYGGSDIGRGVMRQLEGTTLGPVLIRDGLPTPPPEAGEFPYVDIAGDGSGLFAARDQNAPYETYGSVLPRNGEWGAATKLATDPADAPTGPVTAAVGDGRGVFAWRHDPGGGGARSILARVQTDTLAGQITVSDPSLGSVTPFGLYAAASEKTSEGFQGTVAIAYAQGEAAERRISVAEIDVPAPPKAAVNGPGVPAKPRGLKVAKKIRLAPRVTPKRVKKGGQIRFRLEKAGRFRISFDRVLAGKRVGRRCVRPKASLKRRPGCRRFARVKGAITLRGVAGLNRVRFQGRINRKVVLKPGRYRVTVVALGKTGRTSPPARAIFRLVRGRG
jgi:hypothetical protein